jgi:hypothetical protein
MHQLADHFPDRADRLKALIDSDSDFASLCISYQNAVDAARRRATDAVYTDPRTAEQLRRTRLDLATAIAARLSRRECAADPATGCNPGAGPARHLRNPPANRPSH